MSGDLTNFSLTNNAFGVTPSIVGGQTIQINNNLQGLGSVSALSGLLTSSRILSPDTRFNTTSGQRQSILVPGEKCMKESALFSLATIPAEMKAQKVWRDLRISLPLPAPPTVFSGTTPTGESTTVNNILGDRKFQPAAVYSTQVSHWGLAAQGKLLDPLNPVPLLTQPVAFDIKDIRVDIDQVLGARGFYIPYKKGTEYLRHPDGTLAGTPVMDFYVVHSTLPMELISNDAFVSRDKTIELTANCLGRLMAKESSAEQAPDALRGGAHAPTAFVCGSLDPMVQYDRLYEWLECRTSVFSVHHFEVDPDMIHDSDFDGIMKTEPWWRFVRKTEIPRGGMRLVTASVYTTLIGVPRMAQQNVRPFDEGLSIENDDGAVPLSLDLPVHTIRYSNNKFKWNYAEVLRQMGYPFDVSVVTNDGVKTVNIAADTPQIIANAVLKCHYEMRASEVRSEDVSKFMFEQYNLALT